MVTVREELQGRGLGKRLLLQLMRVARENGITYFHARFGASNERFRKMLQDTVGAVDSTLDGEDLCVRFPLPPPDVSGGAMGVAE